MANTDKPERPAASSESSQDAPDALTLLSDSQPTHARAQSPAPDPEQPYTNSAPDHAPPPPPHPPSASPFAIPHPKRFNAVNINKKFLQKNSSSAAAASVVASFAAAAAAKSGSPAPRPAPQPSASHSKLVTAKLTSTAQLSTTTGPSWSRPSSATPPVSTTPSTSSNVPPSQPPASTPAVPLFPPAGKVIQPQPRNAVAPSSPLVKKDPSAKPAWGNAKSLPATSNAPPRSDFPTAAEVAQGQSFADRRVTKVEEPKADDPLMLRHVPPQEADAFRGVHLDPNAHHWDEMEEDDDNFLDNVIEFGDGRQYKVAPTITGQPSTTTTPVDGETPVSTADHVSTEPVSKEERFADDFDRSWPRTRQSPIVLQRDLPSRSSQHISVSPTPSQHGHSSAEASRVLFNERSNSLGFPRRSTYGEPTLSPVEPRLCRDALPHNPGHPVHLLQKSPEGTHDTSVQSSRIHAGDFIGRRNVERDGGLHTPGSDYGQNKVRTRDPSGSSGSFQDSRGIGEKRHRRLSGASFTSSIPDGQQPGSSHSSEVPFSRRSQPRESPLQHISVLPASPSAQAPRASQSPGTSHAATLEAQVSGVPVLDIEGVHKTAMHISAERAKQRRQLEEEEREKEKERARKKAAEIETRMMQAEKSSTIEIVQQAIPPAQCSNQLVVDPEEHKPSETAQCNTSERQPSLKPNVRQRDNQVSRSTSSSMNEHLSPSEQVDSWRSKTRSQPQPQPPPVLSSPMFQEASSVVVDDNLEVVDFSDLGKFLGGEQAPFASVPGPSRSPASSDRHSFSTRPVASDFFEDDPPRTPAVKTVTSPSSERHALPVVPETSVLPPSEQILGPSPLVPTAPTQGMKELDSHRFPGPSSTNTHVRNHPSPAASHHRLSKGSVPFRQVTMSALDDVMSRIKGALDNMQVDAGRGGSSNEVMEWRASVTKSKTRLPEPPVPTRTPSKDAKWLPPALRQFQRDLEEEVFGITGCDPPCSPGPVTLVVKLPTTSRSIDALPKRQLQLLKNSASFIRFDTLSWDPPVDGMNKRSLSVNEILFKRPPPGRSSKFRYKVQLPRASRTQFASLPKVNLPSGFPKINVAPGRSKGVDDLPTWRRGPTLPTPTQKTVPLDETPPTLSVTSCSPPPEPKVFAPELTVTQEVCTKSEPYSVRQRTQPKLPAGSAVGFYRDPGPSYQDSKGIVNFIVTSELEDSIEVSQPESSMLLSSIVETQLVSVLPEPKGSVKTTGSGVDGANRDMKLPTLSLITQADDRIPEESTERPLRTPASASFSTPWTKSPLSFSSKDSPARAPDPDHLRAVWSQTADKEQISAVNSLEGIADDLTALPFTIQEVKSEDGETPPPTSAAVASKISLHDVTRAFQQVPTPNTSSHRPPPLSPSAANDPIVRPPTFYPTSLQASGATIRHPFPAFSSPMLAHSPSPTVLYPPTAPSPIPRVSINGHPQLYNQPMWVPIQTSQNNSAVRPVPSPYPTQMVAYPAPTPVHPIYTSGLSPQNVPPSVTGSAPPRPRGMPMLSPVMHPAAPANVPMYNGSPVLMHPPAMIASGHRPPYMNSVPSERGQGRSESLSVATPHMQQASHSQSHIPQQPMYTHVPFSRPSW